LIYWSSLLSQPAPACFQSPSPSPSRSSHLTSSLVARQTAAAPLASRPLADAAPANVDKRWIESLIAQKPDDEGAVRYMLIDVREPHECAASGMIPSAINMPLGEVARAFKESSDASFAERWSRAKPAKDALLVFYCRSGRRSAMAQATLKGAGYARVVNYVGSALDWFGTEP